MVYKTPIYCPHSGGIVAYQEDLMFAVLTHGVMCPHCGNTVIVAPNITW